MILFLGLIVLIIVVLVGAFTLIVWGAVTSLRSAFSPVRRAWQGSSGISLRGEGEGTRAPYAG